MSKREVLHLETCYYLIFFLYIAKEGLSWWMDYANLKHVEKHSAVVPDEFKGKIDEGLLARTVAYTGSNTRFGFLSSLFGNAVVLVFIFGGLLNWYNSWMASLHWSFIVCGLVFFLGLNLVETLLSIPFTLYRTFVIEQRYGFNTMTGPLWLKDFLKAAVLSTVLYGVLIAGALWLVQWSGQWWWLWVWAFFLLFSLFLMYLSPYVIEPLFNTFIPLNEEDLEKGIRELLGKAGITVDRVFSMDASKRSTHTNAYFTGIGPVKRIVLYDTLLKRLTRPEILSVLAHEAGHWKKKHLLKHLAFFALTSLAALYVAHRLLETGLLTVLFNLSVDTFYAKAVLLGFLGGIAAFFLSPASNMMSRSHEKEADRFALSMTRDAEAATEALLKLSTDNLSSLHPHPLYVFFHYAHPPVLQRIRSLKTAALPPPEP